MLPQLTAEESIRDANRVALGTASMEKSDRRKLSAAWQRQARGESHSQTVRAPRAGPPSREALAALGIAVQTVPRSAT